MQKLTYDTFRRIVGVFVKNEKLKQTIEKIGSLDDIDEFFGHGIIGLIEIVYDSNADVEIIEILTGTPVTELDMVKGFEVLSDFFTSIIDSWQRLKPLLANFEFKLGVPKSTNSNDSK